MEYTKFTNLQADNLKVSGMKHLLKLGTVKYNTTGIATKAKVGTIPAGVTLTGMVCHVKTAFNAATTNVLTVGISTDTDKYMGANDITEGTAGVYQKAQMEEESAAVDVYVQYTQTGTAATAGEAVIYAEYMD